jgi:hypothetical protein
MMKVRREVQKIRRILFPSFDYGVRGGERGIVRVRKRLHRLMSGGPSGGVWIGE